MLFSSLGVSTGAVSAAPVAQPDPYADAVTMFLKGDGTAGSNNNTVVDTVSGSSATLISNIAQGPFSPYGDEWCYSCAATSNLLTPSSTALHLNGDFTIEFWFKAPAGAAGAILNRGGGASIAWASYEIVSDGTYINFAGSSANTSYDIGSETGTTGRIGAFVPNVWTHVAVTRHGTTYRGFINGVLGYQQTLAATPYDPTPRGLSILGSYSTTWGTTTPVSGAVGAAVSNLRIVKGTALYTTNFVVPTAPLTAITNTSLLTCMSNRPLDLSANAIAISQNGSGAFLRSSPKRPNQIFSKDTAATLGGSMFAPSTTSQFIFPDSTANSFGTGNFTIECWAYLTAGAANASQAFYMNYTGAFGVGSIYFGKHATYSGRVAVWLGTISTSGAVITDPTLPPVNTWVHYAFVRNGTSVALYRNGISVASTTIAAGANLTTATTKNYIHTTEPGYMCDFRTSNAAIYTANFTPPTAPLTVGANTKMLASAANANIIDITGQQNYETVGNATLSTTQKKFGTASMSFPTDAVGHYIRDVSGYAGKLGAGDFTVEGWFYIISKSASGAPLFTNFDTWGAGAFGIYAGNSAGNVNKYQVALNGAGFPNIQSTVDIIYNQWHHIAAVRKNGTVTLYINGIANGSVASTATLNNVASYVNFVGDNANRYFVGYVDEFRITRGVARYSASFSVSSTEFLTNETTDPYLDGVDVLLLGNGTNGATNNTIVDTSSNAVAITKSGNVAQGSVTPFVSGGGSLYFDGTADYLSFANSSNFAFGTGDFTIDFWFKGTLQEDKFLLGGRSAVGTMYVTTGATATGSTPGALRYVGSSTITSGTKVIADGTWHLCSISRQGTTLRLFVDGILSGSGTDTTNYTTATGTWYVGGNDQSPTTNNLKGYLTNLRIVKGSAAYTGNFTTPTSQLTSITGTSVLLLAENAGVVDSVKRYNVETAVTAAISTSYSKFGGASISIPAGSGYVAIQDLSGAACSPGAGDFTIEFWRYANNFSGLQTLFDKGYTSANGLLLQTATAGNGAITVYISGATVITESGTVNAGQWYHYALVRNGSTITLYRDGVSVGSVVNATNFSLTTPAYIGGTPNGTGTYSIDGYIDDFRFTKGVARYVSAFTAPQSQLPNN